MDAEVLECEPPYATPPIEKEDIGVVCEWINNAWRMYE